MRYDLCRCELCLWWVPQNDEQKHVFGTCTEDQARQVVDVSDAISTSSTEDRGNREQPTPKRRWKQPLMGKDQKCSKFIHRETGEEVDIPGDEVCNG